LQIAVQDHFHEQGIAKPRIVIAEHERSPLFARAFTERLQAPPALHLSLDRDISRTVSELPHPVIGPHYDEINPLISPEVLARIDEVIQHDDREWKAMQQHLERQGISVGNSSAANVSIAARMASEGQSVLTMIFEPFREFYRAPVKNDLPWIFRGETPLQKAATAAAITTWLALAVCYPFLVDPNAPAFPY